VPIKGKIDRVDIWRDFARVADYKTGSLYGARFDMTDFYYGKKIQLPLYLNILIENGYRPAGAFYFPLSYGWKKGNEPRRFSGIFNESDEILEAFDPAFSEREAESGLIEMKRSAKGTAPKNFAHTESELAAVTLYAVRVFERACAEIACGYIAPSPFSEACAYCDCRLMCGFDFAADTAREPIAKIDKGTVITAATLFEKAQKEEQTDGK
jgi:ATP-dependent helicase/DNAse subunit B